VLKQKHGAKSVACCAPTGVAAILCGGQTIHSLAGCGVANTVRDFVGVGVDVGVGVSVGVSVGVHGYFAMGCLRLVGSAKL